MLHSCADWLRDIKNTVRHSIFQNAVLVLSKCDKIKHGNEHLIMDIIELISPQLREFPYK